MGFPESSAFEDIFREVLVHMLPMRDIASLQNTNRRMRRLVAGARNWERLFDSEFGQGDEKIAGSPFARYCRRYHACIYFWRPRGDEVTSAMPPAPYSLLPEFPIRDIAASRTAMLVLSTSGELFGVWLNDKFDSDTPARRLATRENSVFIRVWAGLDLVHAMDTENRIYVWHSLYPLGVLLPLTIDDLQNRLVLARSGKRLHALLVRGIGIVWWTEWLLWPHVDYRVVPNTDPADEQALIHVVDMVILRHGLVYLTDSAWPQIYWVQLLDDRGTPLKTRYVQPKPVHDFSEQLRYGGSYVRLQLYDYNRNAFVAISSKGEVVRGKVSYNSTLHIKNLTRKRGATDVVDMASFYRQHLALTSMGEVLLWGTRGNSMADLRRAPSRLLFGNTRNRIYHLVEDVKDTVRYRVRRPETLPVKGVLRVANGIRVCAALVTGDLAFSPAQWQLAMELERDEYGA